MIDPPPTTTTFIKKLQNRQPEAWTKFRESYVPVVFALARKNTDSDTDAMAISEGVVAKVADNIGKFERRSNQRFRNYVKVVCLRHISDFLRKQESAEKRLDPQLFDKQFNELTLRRAIAIAKERSRHQESSWELFQMRFEQKMSVVAIAEAKGMKAETVQKTIRRIVLAVQKVLAEG